ncbi:SEL1-like repeat protein, partial [Acinetobacter baumannii]
CAICSASSIARLSSVPSGHISVMRFMSKAADASFKLGIGYLNGQFGLDKNYTEAEKWLNKAASQGHPDAERCLQEAFSKLAF